MATVSESGRLSLVDHILDDEYAPSSSSSPLPSTYTASAKVQKHLQCCIRLVPLTLPLALIRRASSSLIRSFFVTGQKAGVWIRCSAHPHSEQKQRNAAESAGRWTQAGGPESQARCRLWGVGTRQAHRGCQAPHQSGGPVRTSPRGTSFSHLHPMLWFAFTQV